MSTHDVLDESARQQLEPLSMQQVIDEDVKYLKNSSGYIPWMRGASSDEKQIGAMLATILSNGLRNMGPRTLSIFLHAMGITGPTTLLCQNCARKKVAFMCERCHAGAYCSAECAKESRIKGFPCCGKRAWDASKNRVQVPTERIFTQIGAWLEEPSLLSSIGAPIGSSSGDSRPASKKFSEPAVQDDDAYNVDNTIVPVLGSLASDAISSLVVCGGEALSDERTNIQQSSFDNMVKHVGPVADKWKRLSEGMSEQDYSIAAETREVQDKRVADFVMKVMHVIKGQYKGYEYASNELETNLIQQVEVSVEDATDSGMDFIQQWHDNKADASPMLNAQIAENLHVDATTRKFKYDEITRSPMPVMTSIPIPVVASSIDDVKKADEIAKGIPNQSTVVSDEEFDLARKQREVYDDTSGVTAQAIQIARQALLNESVQTHPVEQSTETPASPLEMEAGTAGLVKLAKRGLFAQAYDIVYKSGTVVCNATRVAFTLMFRLLGIDIDDAIKHGLNFMLSCMEMLIKSGKYILNFAKPLIKGIVSIAFMFQGLHESLLRVTSCVPGVVTEVIKHMCDVFAEHFHLIVDLYDMGHSAAASTFAMFYKLVCTISLETVQCIKSVAGYLSSTFKSFFTRQTYTEDEMREMIDTNLRDNAVDPIHEVYIAMNDLQSEEDDSMKHQSWAKVAYSWFLSTSSLISRKIGIFVTMVKGFMEPIIKGVNTQAGKVTTRLMEFFGEDEYVKQTKAKRQSILDCISRKSADELGGVSPEEMTALVGRLLNDSVETPAQLKQRTMESLRKNNYDWHQILLTPTQFMTNYGSGVVDMMYERMNGTELNPDADNETLSAGNKALLDALLKAHENNGVTSLIQERMAFNSDGKNPMIDALPNAMFTIPTRKYCEDVRTFNDIMSGIHSGNVEVVATGADEGTIGSERRGSGKDEKKKKPYDRKKKTLNGISSSTDPGTNSSAPPTAYFIRAPRGSTTTATARRGRVIQMSTVSTGPNDSARSMEGITPLLPSPPSVPQHPSDNVAPPQGGPSISNVLQTTAQVLTNVASFTASPFTSAAAMALGAASSLVSHIRAPASLPPQSSNPSLQLPQTHVLPTVPASVHAPANVRSTQPDSLQSGTPMVIAAGNSVAAVANGAFDSRKMCLQTFKLNKTQVPITGSIEEIQTVMTSTSINLMRNTLVYLLRDRTSYNITTPLQTLHNALRNYQSYNAENHPPSISGQAKQLLSSYRTMHSALLQIRNNVRRRHDEILTRVNRDAPHMGYFAENLKLSDATGYLTYAGVEEILNYLCDYETPAIDINGWTEWWCETIGQFSLHNVETIRDSLTDFIAVVQDQFVIPKWIADNLSIQWDKDNYRIVDYVTENLMNWNSRVGMPLATRRILNRYRDVILQLKLAETREHISGIISSSTEFAGGWLSSDSAIRRRRAARFRMNEVLMREHDDEDSRNPETVALYNRLFGPPTMPDEGWIKQIWNFLIAQLWRCIILWVLYILVVTYKSYQIIDDLNIRIKFNFAAQANKDRATLQLPKDMDTEQTWYTEGIVYDRWSSQFTAVEHGGSFNVLHRMVEHSQISESDFGNFYAKQDKDGTLVYNTHSTPPAAVMAKGISLVRLTNEGKKLMVYNNIPEKFIDDNNGYIHTAHAFMVFFDNKINTVSEMGKYCYSYFIQGEGKKLFQNAYVKDKTLPKITVEVNTENASTTQPPIVNLFYDGALHSSVNITDLPGFNQIGTGPTLQLLEGKGTVDLHNLTNTDKDNIRAIIERNEAINKLPSVIVETVMLNNFLAPNYINILNGYWWLRHILSPVWATGITCVVLPIAFSWLITSFIQLMPDKQHCWIVEMTVTSLQFIFDSSLYMLWSIITEKYDFFKTSYFDLSAIFKCTLGLCAYVIYRYFTVVHDYRYMNPIESIVVIGGTTALLIYLQTVPTITDVIDSAENTIHSMINLNPKIKLLQFMLRGFGFSEDMIKDLTKDGTSFGKYEAEVGKYKRRPKVDQTSTTSNVAGLITDKPKNADLFEGILDYFPALPSTSSDIITKSSDS